jgi:hypothetical protein
MGEFSYVQSLEKTGQLGKTNWDAMIRVYDDAGNLIQTYEHKGDFKER